MTTNTERLRAATPLAMDADEYGPTVGWGEPSTIFAERYSFAHTGATNSKVHVALGYGLDAESLCGVGIAGDQAQTLNTLIDRGLCRKCLAVLEQGDR